MYNQQVEKKKRVTKERGKEKDILQVCSRVQLSSREVRILRVCVGVDCESVEFHLLLRSHKCRKKKVVRNLIF